MTDARFTRVIWSGGSLTGSPERKLRSRPLGFACLYLDLDLLVREREKLKEKKQKRQMEKRQ